MFYSGGVKYCSGEFFEECAGMWTWYEYSNLNSEKEWWWKLEKVRGFRYTFL